MLNILNNCFFSCYLWKSYLTLIFLRFISIIWKRFGFLTSPFTWFTRRLRPWDQWFTMRVFWVLGVLRNASTRSSLRSNRLYTSNFWIIHNTLIFRPWIAQILNCIMMNICLMLIFHVLIFINQQILKFVKNILAMLVCILRDLLFLLLYNLLLARLLL